MLSRGSVKPRNNDSLRRLKIFLCHTKYLHSLLMLIAQYNSSQTAGKIGLVDLDTKCLQVWLSIKITFLKLTSSTVGQTRTCCVVLGWSRTWGGNSNHSCQNKQVIPSPKGGSVICIEGRRRAKTRGGFLYHQNYFEVHSAVRSNLKSPQSQSLFGSICNSNIRTILLMDPGSCHSTFACLHVSSRKVHRSRRKSTSIQRIALEEGRPQHGRHWQLLSRWFWSASCELSDCQVVADWRNMVNAWKPIEERWCGLEKEPSVLRYNPIKQGSNSDTSWPTVLGWDMYERCRRRRRFGCCKSLF
jgi:hypothetical protein